MIRTVDSDATSFLDNLRRLNARIERSQREVSTGKRLLTVSDDADSVSTLLEARADLARVEQNQKNLDRVKVEVNTAEMSLQAAVTLFDKARTLAMSGANGTQSTSTRAGLAGELASILDRMVALSNTEIEGRYVFSGNNDQNPPYGLDLAQNPPWTTYQGASGGRQVEDPVGVRFGISMNAQEIFDNPDAGLNVFQAIENVRLALLSDNDTALQDALAPLSAISAHLNTALTFYGNVQNRVEESINTAAALRIRVATEIAAAEDADVTESIVTLQQLQFTRDAALKVRAEVPRRTLFDVLG